MAQGVGQGADAYSATPPPPEIPNGERSQRISAALCALMRTRPRGPADARAGVGRMFWLWWKTLPGSYVVFTFTSPTQFRMR